MAPMASTSPPFMSTAPDPTSVSPSRVSGRCSACGTTVSRWPRSSTRLRPVPRSVASRSGAWSGEEQGMRSTVAASGSRAAHTDAHSSAPWTSPDGEEAATRASSSRVARRAISAPASRTHVPMGGHGPVRGGMPELPEMEIARRRLARALPGQVVESVMTRGLNVLKTFDPPLHRLEGRELTGVRRRGKLLLLDAGEDLTLLMHLMSAGRLQLLEKRASLKDRTSRVLIRLPEGRELRLREFGTKQAAWIKLLTPEGLAAEESLERLGPEAWPDPPEDLRPLLSSPRPLHSQLRDQQVIAGIGRTWVDDILHAARLSPFKRGDDLSEEEAAALREAIVGELGRVLDVYEERVELPLPEKYPKPTRVHAHQGDPCPRCETVLEAVFYEDYVMTYCPHCQTEGRVLKDRRLSRLLK